MSTGAWIAAAISVARADIAEQGFAISRARVVHAGPAPEIACYPVKPSDPDTHDDWFLAQLTGGRERVITAFREQGPRKVPRGAQIVASYMDMLPVELRGEHVFAVHVEVWETGHQVTWHVAVPYALDTSTRKPALLTSTAHTLISPSNNSTETPWTKLN